MEEIVFYVTWLKDIFFWSGDVDFKAIITDDLVSQVASKLVAAILSGGFSAGERINEVHIAQQMNTSRGPVREALRKLESQGLIVSRPRHGFFVREYTSTELHEIYEARLCLELHAAQVAVERMTADDMAALWRQFEAIRTAATAADTQTQVLADFDFHLMIVQIAGNSCIHRLMRTLATETLAGITLIGNISRDPVYNAETHLPILHAFEKRDAQAVLAALAEHIESGRDEIIRRYKEKHLT
ncbi:GntR family transcriptional regulator [Pararhodobacter sp.]|uniref:GntR family transcriptional regulator n=1 Tax=Pararhodobacter sp. TaxID=2127056 RepID=UPI002FDE02E4